MEQLMETELMIEVDDDLVELFEEYSTEINGEVIFYREGTFYTKDEDGEYETDFSLVWFYKDQNHPEDYLYFEEGAVETAIHNLQHYLGVPSTYYVLNTKALANASDLFISMLANLLIVNPDKDAALKEIFSIMKAQCMVMKVEYTDVDIKTAIGDYLKQWAA